MGYGCDHRKLGICTVNWRTSGLGEASSSRMLRRRLGNHYKKIAYDRIDFFCARKWPYANFLSGSGPAVCD